jgi:AAA family ATP:ADP antiporter
MVLGSRFLLAVAVATLLLNSVKTLGESVLFDAVGQAVAAEALQAGITGDAELRAFRQAGTTLFYGDFFFWINALALFLQVFVASRLLRFGGFAALFLMLPAVALTSYAAMLAVPVLWVIKTMKIVENATDYSIQNTARHVLWLPLSQEVTFKAKPTIDSLFMRAGDGLAALTVLVGHQVFSFGFRSYFVVNVGLIVIWFGLAVWIAKEHGKLAETGGGTDPQVSPGPPRTPRGPEPGPKRAASDEAPDIADIKMAPRTAPAG